MSQQLTTQPKTKRPDARPHSQWRLMRVQSGHTGWVRSLAVDVSNQWFASGSADRTIKIWDLPSGTLKLTLTGHIGSVRGLAVSPRHPYLFSVSDDKMIKCWDLEQNKVVRHYHGHLSGVYAVALHPTLDLLVTAGRDATARVWDLRTRQAIHVLGGHKQTVSAVLTNECKPQIVTAGMDATIRLWDVVAGKTMAVLTHHKRSVRTLAGHPTEYTFVSGATDHLKKWKLPEGTFLNDFDGHDTVINTVSVNHDNVLVSGGDNGSLRFWDWGSGECFQKLDSIPQPGSLDCEAAIYASTFDRTGLRLLTGEGDKSIKVWKEVEVEPDE
ncbi:Pre-mRNA-splicing factor prp5 [Paramicrosporidium saccamoebae]|uniref:Pre-mRNA-splicing factor prp5 n=1 Tax=Paramicrosporidium saccamoebae TaxID=1246581 RepID=A0A2H9TPK8_9FUNG|nr:Pre-mRNA-splicing factor prp5 [Paramicrosporidium saccamoebae]